MAGGTPVAVFDDHRWTLPLVALAAQQGLTALPATLVSFDRHRDSLAPLGGAAPLKPYRAGASDMRELLELVRVQLSPRDDDWIAAGMEMGLIGDVVQFSSNLDMTEPEPPVHDYRDHTGALHRMFRLGRPQNELSFKGALADPEHPAWGGLREAAGWDPGGGRFAAPYILDLDLDYWTLSWDTYTFPFPAEVFAGEFGAVCQPTVGTLYPVARFFEGLLLGTPLVTIAREPDFCGGEANAESIFAALEKNWLGCADLPGNPDMSHE